MVRCNVASLKKEVINIKLLFIGSMDCFQHFQFINVHLSPRVIKMLSGPFPEAGSTYMRLEGGTETVQVWILVNLRLSNLLLDLS